MVPSDGLKTNPDRDYFVVMPKNALPKGIRVASKHNTKDTFAPSEIDDIPKISMFRQVVRCSVCDFATKVRLNLVKHLRLHLRSDETKEVPFITPVNPVSTPVEGDSSFAKMTSNLDMSEEELMKRPMSDEEMYQMPTLIPENHRNACPEMDCQYVTVDTVMLVSHMDLLHPEFNSQYKCPHCPPDLGVSVAFDDLEFHLRCHGELLFKCCHCPYYHWQKRTAEKHVQDEHLGAKIFVRDVRHEAELLKKNKTQETKKKKSAVASEDKKGQLPSEITYQPYKCGLCDHASETIEAIRDHCCNVHEIKHQFKCLFCDTASDNKSEIEEHCVLKHSTSTMMRTFYVDPTSTITASDPAFEEKREPLWSRDMPGLKHIRGILYEEYPDMVFEDANYETTSSTSKSASTSFDGSKKKEAATEKAVDEVDNFPMKCKECGLQKKTIKGLKMHIKLLHLRTGKFLCKRCQFSANMVNSINTHYKIKHPEAAEDPDFEERSDGKMVFSHDFWKDNWGIPTLAERKAMVHSGKRDLNEIDDIDEVMFEVTNSKKRKAPVGRKGQNKKMKKRGVKRKKEVAEAGDDDGLEGLPTIQKTFNIKIDAKKGDLDLGKEAKALGVEKPLNVMEISPFEQVPTYKCQYCSKRTNILERVEIHMKIEHPNKSPDDIGYKTLTRDQVVDLLTLNLTSKTSEGAQFICYFCEDVVGNIYELKTHFANEHNQGAITDNDNAFKVKRVIDSKKTIPGYLECQICGYLSPGFDRSKQRMHFHDEHPMEQTINCSKYVLRSKAAQNPSANKSDSKATEFDPLKYFGMLLKCPKEECPFENTSNAAMNAHLRKHTQTFKCGHCGKTHPNSSEFHRHSAMVHGDK